MKQLVIGISGVARAGKNTFANILESRLKFVYNKTCTQFALANALKSDCEDFINDKMGLNVWSDKTEEKELFRPILVTYGHVKRVQSNGMYWTDLLGKQIEKCDSNVVLVTDIRYAKYEKDEVYWIKNTMCGQLIHLSKFITEDGISIQFNASNPKKIYTLPPNDHEKENDPKVKEQADYKVEWEDQVRYYDGDVMNNPYMNNIVDGVIVDLIKRGLL
jgi:hypothetical protein